MIKKIVYILIFITNGLYSQGNQPVSVGNWRIHLNYQNAQQLAEVRDKIYCSTTNGMFVFKKDGGITERLSPINGFHGYDVEVLHYDENSNTLIIAYSDGVLELLKDNSITQNEDIKRSTISTEKKIHHINTVGDYAYFSTSFGLQEFYIPKNEFRNSYWNIGPNGDKVEVLSSAVLHDSIFISTKLGIMKGSLSPTTNLNNFNSWTMSKQATFQSHYIASFRNHLYAELDSQLYKYNNGIWSPYEYDPNIAKMIVTNISVLHNKLIIGVFGKYMITEDENGNITKPSVNIVNKCIIDTDNKYWYTSPNNGLVGQDPAGDGYFYPNGPRAKDNFSFINAYGKLYCSSGSFSATTYAPTFNGNKYYAFDNFSWQNSESNPILDTISDLTHMAYSAKTGKLFIGTHPKGLMQMDNGVPTKIYQPYNSPLKKRAGQYCIISGLAMDKDNNLWVSNFDTDSALLQLSNTGKWISYMLPVGEAGKIIIDSRKNKWIITPRSGTSIGFVYFNDKNTPAKADDEIKSVTTTKGMGNLPSSNISAIAFTKDGEMLIGSDQGYGRIRTPNNIETGGNFDFERIVISVEEGTNLGGYLLGSEFINCITLDGGERRWVGTNNGVWLIDNDGETILQHFTMENSPLLSNNVNCIGIAETTGEVFFGTDRGIVSYRSDALNESKDLSDIKIFPNPVRPDFDGEIAITGLQDNSLVKITDINGQLVYQTYSNGGMATWNCRRFDGTRPATGVYLAFCINKDGTEKGMGKILFIK